MFKKLKIGQKLVITFVLVALLSSISGIISLFLLKSADADYSDTLVSYGFSQGDIGLLMNSFTDNVSSLMQMMATTDKELLQEAQSRVADNLTKIDTYMAAIEPVLVGDEERGYYDIISTNLPDLTEHAEEVVKLAVAGQKLAAMELYQQDVTEHLNAITAAVQGLMDYNRSEGTNISDTLTRTSNITLVAMIAVIAVVLVLSVIIAIVMSNSVSKPLGACAQRLVLLSEGDLKSPAPAIDTEDETGTLARATDVLLKKLNVVISEMCSVLGSMAKGDFTVTLDRPYGGDFSPLQVSTKQIIESLNGTLEQIAQSADQVSGGSDQVSSGAQALSQGATEQASAVEELAATISEISTQINQNAADAAEAKHKANGVGDEMAQSNRQMGELNEAMTRISQSSGEIGKIIKTIEDIAFQTNILALNAAVEAARAGAAGKGFAVVADEVRNLANKSQEASKNTAALIENSILAVEQGTRIAGETAQSLLHAVDGATDVVRTVDRISEASSAQASSIAQITQGVEQISNVVQTNSATAEQSAAASEELSGQAQIMKSLVNKFQLKGQSGGYTEEAPAYAPSAPSPAAYSADKY